MKGMLLLFSLVLMLQAQGPAPKVQTSGLTKQGGIELIDSMFKACNPDLPENVSYMPALLRQKLRWIYIEKIGRRLHTRIAFNENNEYGSIMMFAGYGDTGIPFITIVADYVVLSVRVDSGLKTGFGKMNKNSFCLGLAHEATHLEKPRSFFRPQMTRAEKIQEEFRTYKKLKPVVIELGRKKELLENEDVEIYKVVAKCSGSVACPAFVQEFSERAKIIPNFPKK